MKVDCNEMRGNKMLIRGSGTGHTWHSVELVESSRALAIFACLQALSTPSKCSNRPRQSGPHSLNSIGASLLADAWVLVLTLAGRCSYISPVESNFFGNALMQQHCHYANTSELLTESAESTASL